MRKRTEDPFLFLILSLVHILKGRNKYVTGLQQENDFIQLAGRYMTEWKWISVLWYTLSSSINTTVEELSLSPSHYYTH